MKIQVRQTDRHSCYGVTLIELLVAITVSALVIVFATKIFLSGNLQFLERGKQSDNLITLFKLKNEIDKVLAGQISRCESGKIWIQDLEPNKDPSELFALLKLRIGSIVSSDFHCFEIQRADHSLIDWQGRFQPSLVEYKLVISQKGKVDSLIGSVLK